MHDSFPEIGQRSTIVSGVFQRFEDIIATGLDPCAAATTGCTLDSAVHITLPPDAYTAIISGVSGGAGVGLVGVFDVDSSAPNPNAWVYDSANRLTSRPGLTYTYDNNGNTLTKTDSTGTTTYT